MKLICILFCLTFLSLSSFGQLTQPPRLDTSVLNYSYSDYMNENKSIKLNAFKLDSPIPIDEDENWEMYYSQTFNRQASSSNLLIGQESKLYNPNGANSFGGALIGGTLNYLLNLGN